MTSPQTRTFYVHSKNDTLPKNSGFMKLIKLGLFQLAKYSDRIRTLIYLKMEVPASEPCDVIRVVRNTINYIIVQLFSFFLNIQRSPSIPASTRRRDNVVSMLGHRLRRWPNIKTTLSQRLVIAVIFWDCYKIAVEWHEQADSKKHFLCWPYVGDPALMVSGRVHRLWPDLSIIPLHHHMRRQANCCIVSGQYAHTSAQPS